MQIYPAIDIKNGRAVRFVEGEDLRETRYATHPVAQAEAYAAAGATWLHVVDLDRAFDTGGNNTALVHQIASLPKLSVQVGGNLRGAEDARIALDAGAARVVVGTGAVADSPRFEEILREAREASLAVAIDVRDGEPALRGSPGSLGVAARELVARAVEAGVKHIVYKDLARDGLLAGGDVAGAAALVGLGAGVIVSGGVASLQDLDAARTRGLAGVIVGRALHEGRFRLEEALECSR